jgi:hypothetical protein
VLVLLIASSAGNWLFQPEPVQAATDLEETAERGREPGPGEHRLSLGIEVDRVPVSTGVDVGGRGAQRPVPRAVVEAGDPDVEDVVAAERVQRDIDDGLV